MLFLVAAAVFPLALFAGSAVLLLVEAKQDGLEDSLGDTVRALSSAVDNELQRSVAAAETLAITWNGRDSESLYAVSRKLLDRQPGWIAVALTTADGRYVFNSNRPLGRPLPEFASPAALIQEVGESQRPAIGDLVIGQVSQEPLLTVHTPIVQDERTRYVLSVAISPHSMRELLRRQVLPEGATVAILDRKRVVVARSRQHEAFVGTPATDDLQDLMRGRREGFGVPRTLEGTPTYAAFSTSPLTGWSVVVGLPRSSVLAPQRTAYVTLLLGLALSLIVAALAARAVSRSILRPIEQLRASADAIAAGQEAPVAQTDLHEIREVSEALALASRSVLESKVLRELVLRQEQEARRAAETVGQEKDEFIATLSHELRNPLAALGNAVELLRRMSEPSAPVQKWYESMSRQVRHLSHLMNDLLDVGRAVAGKISLKPETVDLALVVQNGLRALADAGATSKHRLVTSLEPLPVRADAERMHQVIVNLVGNAAKYSPEGSTISVGLRRDRDTAVITVADQGIGMDPDTCSRVFDLFFQRHLSTSRAEGGLGIGLTLVKRIVELHGGTISATSPGAGSGSVFTVSLPLEREREPGPPGQDRPADPDRPAVA